MSILYECGVMFKLRKCCQLKCDMNMASLRKKVKEHFKKQL